MYVQNLPNFQYFQNFANSYLRSEFSKNTGSYILGDYMATYDIFLQFCVFICVSNETVW